METPTPAIAPPAAEESPPPGLRSAGLLWMGAGALVGGSLVSLWVLLAVLAAMLQLPIPSPGLAVLGLWVGGGLFREGRRIARGEPDVPLPAVEGRALTRAMCFTLILAGCGAIAEVLFPQQALPILPFHIGVALLAPMVAFDLLRWRMRMPWSRRAAWWGWGLGGFLAPALAMFLEAVAGAFLVLSLLLLRVLLEGPGFLTGPLPGTFPPGPLGPSLPARWLADPWVWVGLLIGAAVLIPPLEEALKSLPAALRVRDPGVSDAALILYGAMGGAGFALAENLVGWQPGVPWTPTIVGRLGATALHVLTGGVTGWGWSRLRRRRFGEGIAAYLLAGLIHGLWNAGVVALNGAFLAPLPAAVRTGVALLALTAMGIALGLTLGGLGWALPALGSGEAASQAPSEG